jgi:hypothetical protein
MEGGKEGGDKTAFRRVLVMASFKILPLKGKERPLNSTTTHSKATSTIILPHKGLVFSPFLFLLDK